MADGYLSSYGIPDTGSYQRAQDALGYQWASGQATNAYAQYNQRGLSGAGIKSGTQKRAMGNYLGDYVQDYGRGQQDLAQSLQQYDLNSLQDTANYKNSLAQLEQQKQSEIANAALGIQALRPYLGGT